MMLKLHVFFKDRKIIPTQGCFSWMKKPIPVAELDLGVGAVGRRKN